MKPTLLFATLSLVLACPAAFAKSELETLRSRCLEQERQIRQLEDENSRLRSDGHSSALPAARQESSVTPVKDEKPYSMAATTATYTVKSGDSFMKIARKVGTSPEKLAKSNGLKTSSIIRPGQKLKVPGAMAKTAAPVSAEPAAATPASGASSHKVRAGETFSSISRKHAISTEALIAANPKVKPSALRPGQVINLQSNRSSSVSSSTTLISTQPKAAAPTERTATPPMMKPTPMVQAAATEAPSAAPQTQTPAPAEPPAVEKEILSPNPEKKIRPVTIEGEMTYGEFATKHGTDAERLNALNGLDLTTATVLAKGSELYVPAQP